MFKKGDRVICIANDGWETELEVGEIFTVLDTEGNSIIVEVKNCGCKIKFASDRFELVEKLEPNQKSVFKTGDKVICIKADDSKSLIEGMKYTVYGVNNNCIFIMDGQGVFLTSYSKKLFKLAKEELKTTFADVKVGDRVYDIRYGWGTIIDSPFKRYPIAVNFDDGKAMDSYTLDGISEEKYLTPTLYWDVPTIITPPRKVVKKELK
jgi:co-chaperonin GroES (HSP10)